LNSLNSCYFARSCVVNFVQVISAAVDLGLSANTPSSATTVCFSENVCSVAHSVCSSHKPVVSRLHSTGSKVSTGTDSCMTAHREIAQSDNVVGFVSKDDPVDEINMDVQDLSSAEDSLFETTLEYSVCSDLQNSKIVDTCELQPTMEYCVESTTEPVIDVEKNPVADIRRDAPLTDDLQKPVDLLTISNNVSVDLRKNPTVCSPPTLMVV